MKIESVTDLDVAVSLEVKYTKSYKHTDRNACWYCLVFSGWSFRVCNDLFLNSLARLWVPQRAIRMSVHHLEWFRIAGPRTAAYKGVFKTLPRTLERLCRTTRRPKPITSFTARRGKSEPALDRPRPRSAFYSVHPSKTVVPTTYLYHPSINPL